MGTRHWPGCVNTTAVPAVCWDREHADRRAPRAQARRPATGRHRHPQEVLRTGAGALDHPLSGMQLETSRRQPLVLPRYGPPRVLLAGLRPELAFVRDAWPVPWLHASM